MPRARPRAPRPVRRYLGRYRDVHVHVAADATHLRPGAAGAGGLLHLTWAAARGGSGGSGGSGDSDNSSGSVRVLSAKVTVHPEAARRKRNTAYVPCCTPAAPEEPLSPRVSPQHDLRGLPPRAPSPATFLRRGPKNAPFVYAAVPTTPPAAARMGPVCHIPTAAPAPSAADGDDADDSDDATENRERVVVVVAEVDPAAPTSPTQNFRHRAARRLQRQQRHSEAPDAARDVLNVIPFYFDVPADTPESASFMENSKKDCRIDIRVRLSAEIHIELSPSSPSTPNAKSSSSFSQPLAIVLVAENFIKILPPCRPPSPYLFAPTLWLSTSSPPCGSSFASSHISLGAAHSLPNALGNSASQQDPSTAIGGLYPNMCFLIHLSVSPTARVGESLDAKITLRVVGQKPDHPLHVRAAFLQRTFFGSDEPRARRAITNELFTAVDGTGAGAAIAHFVPSRRNAFYPSTNVGGTMRIEHVVRAQIFDKGILCGLAEAPVCLLPGDPSAETYRAQNPAALPNWCAVAERRFRCPVEPVELAEVDGDDLCVICLDNLRTRPATKLVRCGHFGHVACMEEWFDCKPVCPTCNSPISEHHAATKDISCCELHQYDLASPSLTQPFG